MIHGEHAALARGFRPVAPGRLPVYMCEHDEFTIFSAPRFVSVVPRDLTADAENRIGRLSGNDLSEKTDLGSCPVTTDHAASRVVRAAHEAENAVARQSQAAFAPECLTLFLNNACNLECRYCHASPGAEPERALSDEAIRAAGEAVAASCAQRHCSFTVALLGGGEPSLDGSRVDRVLDIVGAAALRHDVPQQTYVATNGFMSEDRARWLVDRFDLIGLSWDGPPDVQDRQRPARDGRPTSPEVGRTAAILQQAGKPFHIRATITKESVGRQAEITAYFVERYAPAEIRLEPVYAGPADATLLGSADAPVFVAGFMDARKVAATSHVEVTTSLTRPASLYGRYCNVLRQVLNLAPGDIATACFLESREADIDRRHARVGAMNTSTACFDLDADRLEMLLAQCSEIPSGCRHCLCRLQCTYGCPDMCVLRAPASPAREEDAGVGFRCHANRLLMEALIREAADTAWRRTPPGVDRDVLVSGAKLRVAVYKEASAGDIVA